MKREDNIKKACIKVREAFDKMNASKDMDCLVEEVQINKRLVIQIECGRIEHGEDRGLPIGFQLFAIKDGKEVDCCTVYLLDEVNAEIMYLVNCYI